MPRGVVTTRRDPEGRRTVYDVLGDAGGDVHAVGRLDLASTGLLLLTTDNQFANWITDPAHAVPRIYVVTVRGAAPAAALAALPAPRATLRRASARESHLTVELREGKNREVRRMFEAIGHEVTRLKRVVSAGSSSVRSSPASGGEVTRAELRAAFPAARISASS
jgi:23S rRNA pseudouridine2605 synthase